jgi:hypothetical protein
MAEEVVVCSIGVANVDARELERMPLPIELFQRGAVREDMCHEFPHAQYFTFFLSSRQVLIYLFFSCYILIYYVYLFFFQTMRGRDVEIMCDIHCPILVGKIVCIVERKLVRCAPTTNSTFLL